MSPAWIEHSLRGAKWGALAGTLSGGLAAAVGIGQGTATLAAAAFFSGSNCFDNDDRSPASLGVGCGGIGFFLSYGWASAVKGLLADSFEATDTYEDSLRLPFFFVFIMLFHAAEFLFVVQFHPQDVGMRSLMLAPVPAGGYSIAMIVALVEYWITRCLFGRMGPRVAGAALFWLGSGLCFSGWALRTVALFTAKSNFTHIVAFAKESSHQLVTSGVYSFCRHPSYLGWFVWSVASQLVLGNFVSFAAYFFVSWKFFEGRIPGEEEALVRFFGVKYIDYARRVPCGLPFISRLRV